MPAPLFKGPYVLGRDQRTGAEVFAPATYDQNTGMLRPMTPDEWRATREALEQQVESPAGE